MPSPIQISPELAENILAGLDAAQLYAPAEDRHEHGETYDQFLALTLEHADHPDEESPFAGEEGT